MISKIKDITILVLFLLLAITTTVKNNKIKKLENKVDVPAITIYDTIPSIIVETDFVPEYIITPSKIVIDSINVEQLLTAEDSLAIFDNLLTSYIDYSSAKFYSGTLKNDSSMLINYNASVSYNKLDSIILDVTNRYPYKIIEEKEIIKNRLLLGADVYADNVFANIGVENKKGTIYSLGYSPITKSFGIGIKITAFKF